MMSQLSAIFGKIKVGQVIEVLEDVKTFLSECKGANERQQILRYCSRYVYETKDINQESFAAVVAITDICCKHEPGEAKPEPAFQITSMYYIILIATKKKEFHQYLIQLLSCLEPYVKECDTIQGNVENTIKSLYSCLWNFSLGLSSASQAFVLQRYALHFLLIKGRGFSKFCEQSINSLLNFEHVDDSSEKLKNLEEFCLISISNIVASLKAVNACDCADVRGMFDLLLQYAKFVSITNRCVEFSKITRSLVNSLEGKCDMQMLMALKVGIKLVEVGMAIKVGKCKEDMLANLMQACGVIAKEGEPNVIVLLSLIRIIGLLKSHSENGAQYIVSDTIVKALLNAQLTRCNSQMPSDCYKQIASVLCEQLECYVNMMRTCADKDVTLKEALPWVSKAASFITLHCESRVDTVWEMYNVGVNAGNLAVLSFKHTKYDAAAKLLLTTINMFDIYCKLVSDDQKLKLTSSYHKKITMLSDSLRYSGQHWEAALAAGQGFLRGFLSVTDLIAIWVKCKRDAEKFGNKTLRVLTVCDVVTEAKKKYNIAADISLETFAALKSEINLYKKQSCDTSENVLACGRAIIACSNSIEVKAFGYLVVTEVLWVNPNLASTELESLQTVNKAISILQPPKSCSQLSSRMLELKAIANFWLYLIQLQQLQETASADVQEAQKQGSLTTAATDLGEEEQVNDVCDVRPTSTFLTLHAQETAFAALHTARSIWQDLDQQGVTLQDGAMCCSCLTSAGYVYQLSGMTTATVQTWSTLISIAKRHNLNNYITKGLTELCLVVPELIPVKLVLELDHLVKTQAAGTQDSSILYSSLTATASIAYYYFKAGEYKTGAHYISSALKNEVMKKRTVRATEAIVIVHHVASLYAWLPPWILEPGYGIQQPCISLALLSCRESIGLLEASLSTTNEIACWRHRVCWLFLKTAAWLGHLCVMTAQPRLARAYLKQPLTVAQKLALPLRTAEILELLAQVDMLSDQLEDCRVKVDSLQGILVAHPPPAVELNSTTPKPNRLSKHAKTKVLSIPKLSPVSLDSDTTGEEKMRAWSASAEFSLNSFVCNSGLVVVGPEERVSMLANAHYPASPSMSYREDVSTIRVESCPIAVVDCGLCSSPAVHRLRISTAILLARIHAYRGHHQAAYSCLIKAEAMYAEVKEKSLEIAAKMTSVISRESTNETSLRNIISLRLNLVLLQRFHASAECLALEQKWEEALNINLKALENVKGSHQQVLLQDMHFIVVIILQGQALQQFLHQEAENTTIKGDMKENSDWVNTGDENINECKTPDKTPTNVDGVTSLKSTRKVLGTKNVVETVQGFDIYSEDETEECAKPTQLLSPNRGRSKRIGRKSTLKPKAASTAASKKKCVVSEIDSQLNALTLDDSPDTHLLLQVPNPFPDLANVKSLKTYTAKKERNKPPVQSTSTRGRKQASKNSTEKRVHKTLIFGDSDSPNTDSAGGIDEEDKTKDSGVDKPQPITRTRKASSSSTTTMTTTTTKSKSKSKPVKDTNSQPKTRRACRSLRLV